MNTQKHYIPINRNKLAYFLGMGVIVPSRYLPNAQKDIQDKFDGYILFSTYKFTSETDCCIEVVLSTEESPQVKPISNSFSVFDMPLPISRVIAIYFRSEEECSNTVHNITKVNGDAFIPKRLQCIENEDALDTAELQECEPNPKDWSLELKRFDQLMGGFSLMKLSTEGKENYTKEYFQALGNLNKYFESDTLNHKFTNLLNQVEPETSDSLSELYSRLVFSGVNPEKVIEFSQKENVQISKKFGDIDISSINKEKFTYILSVLSIYGSFGGSKTVDDFLSDFMAGELYTEDPLELPLVFGINRGYKDFSNQYSFSGDVKFKLERKVEYYVIESIYQSVFNLNHSYDPVNIIDIYQDLPYEYYDSLENEVLEAKKKQKTGFFALLPIFSQKYINDADNHNLLNGKIRNVVDFIIGWINIVDQKIIGLERRLDNGAKYITGLKVKLNQRIDDASTKSEDALAGLQSEIQNSYASKAETANLKHTIDQEVADLEGRLNQDIQRIDHASVTSEKSLTDLQSEIQNNYASKTETADLKHTIDQGVADLEGRLNQDIQRINHASVTSEKSLTDLQSEIQNNYASKTETADLKHTIDQGVADLEGRLNQGIQRIDDASTKSEDRLADLKLEIQNNYASKTETADLNYNIEQRFTDLEKRLNADNVSKSSNDLEKKVDSLEQKIKDLEQALSQAKMPETRMVKTKKKSNENGGNELGDLFGSESEVLNEDRVEELTKLKRMELNEIATSYGLSYKTYPTKFDIANAIAFQEYNNDNDN
jgi:DNA-binding transcriptional regulator YbjK